MNIRKVRTFVWGFSLFLGATVQAAPFPFFHEVYKEGKEPCGFVLGTYHVGVGLKDLPAKVQKALQLSDQVLVETLGTFDPTLYSNFLLPPDQSLSQLLSAEAYAWLVNKAVPKYLSEIALQRLRPAAVSALMGRMLLEENGIMLDLEILEVARRRGIPIRTLDEKPEQALVRWLVEERMARLELEKTQGDILSQIEDTVRCWTFLNSFVAQGSRQEAKKYLKGKLPNGTATTYPLAAIRDRHKAWLEKIVVAFSNGKKTFVAFGADHLNDVLSHLLDQKLEIR